MLRLFVLAVVFFFISSPASATGTAPSILDQSALKDGLDGRGYVDPCDDFYRFACGTWIDQTQIPPDKKAVYRQSIVLDDQTDIALYKILKSYADGNATVSAAAANHLGDFFHSCVSAEQSAPAAAAFVKDAIKKFSALSDKKSLSQLTAKLNLYGLGAFFSIGSAQSYSDSSKVILNVAQGGFLLGEREYYFDTDEKSVEIRAEYKNYIARLFQLIGYDLARARSAAANVLKIETRLAEKAYIAADRSDPAKTNHPIGRSGLQRLMPHFDWSTYLASVNLSAQQAINVEEPEFFSQLDAVISQLKKQDFEQYFTWLLLNRSAPMLGENFEKTHFNFWSSYMNGAKQMPPRWKLCTHETADHLGYALAEAYVQTIDADAIKSKAVEFIDLIKMSFRQDLQSLITGPEAWLDDATVAEAQNKINSMRAKVGAPNRWRDYSALATNRSDFLSNSLNISLFESLRDLAKIGKPVDRDEWDMMPWEINAYYDRSNNEFVFPFGILQPPSLDLGASDGANLGAFGGGTVGHELTHGFDNSGSQYDSRGNLRNWWSPRTGELFKEKSQCFVEQANNYLIKEVSMKVDGAQTLEENLADQGGVKIGYLALESILRTRPESPLWVDRYSERQQYWIAYAQSWCMKTTPEALRSQITGDEHPPAEFRVNAVLMNQPSFARDFNCSPGRAMAPVNSCRLW